MAITACSKCSLHFDRLQLSLLQGRHIHREYCMSDNSRVLSSISKLRDWEWEVEISWQLKDREDGKYSANVCGATSWKYFWGALIYQNYVGMLGCPSCFSSLPYLIKGWSSQLLQFANLQIHRSAFWHWGQPSLEVGFWVCLRSWPSGGSLLPRARWTVLAGDTLMYELQFLLPLPLSTEKQVCWSVPLDLSVGWIKIALEIELGAGLA